MEMAKNPGSLGVMIVVLLLGLLAPIVTAGRAGGRLCFNPFSFAESFNLHDDGFKLSSFGNNGFLDSPSRLVEDHIGNGFIRVWRVIPSDPHLVTVIHSRRSLWHPHVTIPPTEEESFAVDSGISLLGLVIAFASGFALAFLFYWTMMVLRAAAQKYFMCAFEDHDMGFLYGYQALPSSESCEKNIQQEESAKENAGKMENV